MSEILRLYVPIFKPPDQRAAVCVMVHGLAFFAGQVSCAAVDQVMAILADDGAKLINAFEAHALAGCLLVGVGETERASWRRGVAGKAPWGLKCRLSQLWKLAYPLLCAHYALHVSGS
jgi:hypothetical protein